MIEEIRKLKAGTYELKNGKLVEVIHKCCHCNKTKNVSEMYLKKKYAEREQWICKMCQSKIVKELKTGRKYFIGVVLSHTP